ncbi:substrate-binding domain-containing protein [Nitratireductor sp. ZSWI3]|uniref:molybdate ABC transporter substrate-binding protein n=1 Tax=Nitratireductor sp. ZSWI3 TaxID=2966359 RepID=UPI00214FAE49|nr:substrate-binding domain-containing protein [Nitratireductor sp. ZSWI3]MCR4265197.1 substrate-binding domain-containing protein [Nitratireductor sp. ZSWI3]
MQSATSGLSVMSALAVEVALNRWIIPEFQSRSGLHLDMKWGPTTVLERDVGDGRRADVLLAIDDSIDRLVADGVLVAETRRPIAQAVLGVAVKEGAARYDISTLASFKQMLCNAKGVAFSQAGASGIYFRKMIAELGIAEIVEARAVTIPAGFTAHKVVSGEAELAIQQISELMTVDGVDILGPFPPEVQVTTNFSVAVFVDAKNPADARAFVEALCSPEADIAYRNGGLVSRVSASGMVA